jgi:subtilisin family serine protease
VRVLPFCLVAVLLTAGMATPAVAAEADAVSLDVGLVEGTDSAIVVAAVGQDVLASRLIEGLDAITVDVPADRGQAVRSALAARSDVRYAELGGTVLGYSDPYDNQNLFKMNAVSIPDAWKVTTGSEDVVVAVVDSGVTPNNDLGADRLVAGRDIVDGDDDPADARDHGTLVANLIAAPENGVGITGVCPRCRIMPVRVLENPEGRGLKGSTADLAAGIVWASDHGAQIINLSVGTVTDSRLLADAVRHAVGRGALMVGAAGNDYGPGRKYPAAFEGVLAVGVFEGPARNSPTDRWIDVQAPTAFLALNASSKPSFTSGASGAAALTSGVAALALAAKPGSSAAEIRSAILKSARLTPTQFSYGPSTVDAFGAMTGVDRTDVIAPQVTSLGVTSGQLVGGGSTWLGPTATDNIAVARLELLFDGKMVSSVETAGNPRPGFWYSVPRGSGEMELGVRAYDHAGNSGIRTATIRFDSVSPDGSIVSPAPGAHTRGTIDVIVSMPHKDLAGMDAGGAPMAPVAGTDLWKARVTVLQSGDIDVWARDKAGNNSRMSVPVVLDTAGPTATVISPSSMARLRGTFTTTLSGVKDASGVVKAELWANGTYVGADKAAPYSLAVKTGTISGNTSLTWKLTDKLGNTRSYTRTVVADNEAPTVSITKAPKNKAKVRGTVKIHIKATDANGIARVELMINGKVVAKDAKAAYVLSFSAKKQNKTMKVRVRAYDKLGNAKYTSTRTWHRS